MINESFIERYSLIISHKKTAAKLCGGFYEMDKSV